MKICAAQLKAVKGNLLANIDNHLKWIEVAASLQADLIVFPELSLTGYEPQLAKKLAIDPEDSLLDVFQKISDKNHLTIAVGMPTSSVKGIHISMLIFQPDQKRLTYSKQLLHADELPYFVEGTDQVILSISGSRLAPAICYESMQPTHAGSVALLGIDIYLVSVSKHQKGVEQAFDHYPKMAQKHGFAVIMSNSIGFCDDFESAGQTAVWNVEGKLMKKLSSKQEEILCYNTETGAVSIHAGDHP